MIHYHGGPITPETAALRVWKGRHAFVSWAAPVQIKLAASITQSFALDNGAFTIWRKGGEVDWNDYYAWVDKWRFHSAFDWAVIPDVIGGTEEENNKLLGDWPFGLQGVPVWHMDESVDRLVDLASEWPRVAIGSCAEYDVKHPAKCVARLRQVLQPICRRGYPTVKLHGLRMLRPEIITKIPLSSGDSTNIARNIGIDKAWNGSYSPATREARADVMVERIESHMTPTRIPPLTKPTVDGANVAM